MKNATNFLIIACFILAGAVAFLLANKGSDPGISDQKDRSYDSALVYSKTVEAQLVKNIDSLTAENKAILKSNKLIDKYINKLIKQNEKNKNAYIFGSDSLKLYIIDSILRANGYR